MKRFLIAFLVLLLLPVMTVMAADNSDDTGQRGNHQAYAYLVRNASTSLQSSTISVVGRSRATLNIWSPTSTITIGSGTITGVTGTTVGASAAVVTGEATRCYWIEGKAGTGSATTGFATLPLYVSPSSGSAQVSITGVTTYGCHYYLDLTGVADIRICAEGAIASPNNGMVMVVVGIE